MIILIAAMSENRVIGKDGKLPWHIPEDLKRFRELTLGHTVMMGRKTHESLQEYLKDSKSTGLPDRKNIVVTRNTEYEAPGCEIVHSVEEALKGHEGNTYFIIGGEQLYRQTIDLADKIYLTVVEGEYEGDTMFPKIDEKKWKITNSEDNELLEFRTYEKI